MKEYKDILKNTPEYEKYCDNEVTLTKEEIREFGVLKTSCCCRSAEGDSKAKCCRKSAMSKNDEV